ncbi:uncharacterized protein PV09_07859 [Verruconis gallopava]|uniref:Uncharacterized protein n=1 Tax=Verruconis gallopava TaxID=253628 RepID=A0A0D2A2S1_9PEZI|nr:uncharacterized protein PV09_07859 [Verruconis gallopava]KIW00675.1 hypothetical protein PV09_07859 [Verruconis gallopava]
MVESFSNQLWLKVKRQAEEKKKRGKSFMQGARKDSGNVDTREKEEADRGSKNEEKIALVEVGDSALQSFGDKSKGRRKLQTSLSKIAPSTRSDHDERCLTPDCSATQSESKEARLKRVLDAVDLDTDFSARMAKVTRIAMPAGQTQTEVICASSEDKLGFEESIHARPKLGGTLKLSCEQKRQMYAVERRASQGPKKQDPAATNCSQLKKLELKQKPRLCPEVSANLDVISQTGPQAFQPLVNISSILIAEEKIPENGDTEDKDLTVNNLAPHTAKSPEVFETGSTVVNAENRDPSNNDHYESVITEIECSERTNFVSREATIHPAAEISVNSSDIPTPIGSSEWLENDDDDDDNAFNDATSTISDGHWPRGMEKNPFSGIVEENQGRQIGDRSPTLIITDSSAHLMDTELDDFFSNSPVIAADDISARYILDTVASPITLGRTSLTRHSAAQESAATQVDAVNSVGDSPRKRQAITDDNWQDSVAEACTQSDSEACPMPTNIANRSLENPALFDSVAALDSNQPAKAVSTHLASRKFSTRPQTALQNNLSGPVENSTSNAVPRVTKITKNTAERPELPPLSTGSSDFSINGQPKMCTSVLAKEQKHIENFGAIESSESQSTKLDKQFNNPEAEGKRSISYESQTLPPLCKLRKLRSSHPAWAIVKSYLERGITEPKHLQFLTSNQEELTEILEIKEQKEGKRKKNKCVSTEQNVHAAANPRSLYSNEMATETALAESQTNSKSSKRDDNGRLQGKQTCSRAFQSSRSNDVDVGTGAANDISSIENDSAEYESLGGRVPHPIAHETSGFSGWSSFAEPVRSRANCLASGTSPSSPQRNRRVCGTKRTKSKATRKDLKPSNARENYGEEAFSEAEAVNSRSLEVSPITGSREMHFVYSVKRKQWSVEEDESDADWFSVQEPAYYSIDLANDAAMKETRHVRHGMSLRWSSDEQGEFKYESGMLQWFIRVPQGFIRIKVERTMRFNELGTSPGHTAGWLSTRVWWIKKKTWVSRPRDAQPSALPAANASSDEDDLGSLFKEPVEEKKDQDGEENGDEEEDEEERCSLISESEEQHPDGVWTVQDHANRVAGRWMLDALFDPKSARIDVVNGRFERGREIERWCDELEREGANLEASAVLNGGARKVSIWVAETRVNGPRNV